MAASLLAPYCDYELTVDHFYDVPRDTTETIVLGENLWFDAPFLETFLEDPRSAERRPAPPSVPLIPRNLQRDEAADQIV